MKDATAEARQNAEHDRRIFQLLNRHPLNQSAETIIEARFKDPPIDTGLHFIRLLACVAVAEGLMESDPVLCDIYKLSQMDTYDAVDFMAYLDRELCETGDASFAVEDDFKSSVMAQVYFCLPGHIREYMIGMGECDAFCESYADANF